MSPRSTRRSRRRSARSAATDRVGPMGLRAGPSAVERGKLDLITSNPIQARSSSSRTYDHDRYAFLQHRRLAQAVRKKESPGLKPGLPTARQDNIELIVRPPAQRGPRCRKQIGEQQQRE